MKYSIPIAILFLVNNLFSQSLIPIKLNFNKFEVDKKISTEMFSTSTYDGNDIVAKTANLQTHSYSFEKKSDKINVLSIRFKSIKTKMELAGQTIEYDSDNPQKSNSKIPYEISSFMNRKPTILYLDSNYVIEKIEMDSSILKNDFMSNSFLTDSLRIGKIIDVFLDIKKEIKINETWEDSLTLGESKYIYKYTYVSNSNQTASIEIKGTVNLISNNEMNGTTIKSNQLGLLSGTMLVDMNTLLIKSKKIISTLTGDTRAGSMIIPTKTTISTEESIELK